MLLPWISQLSSAHRYTTSLRCPVAPVSPALSPSPAPAPAPKPEPEPELEPDTAGPDGRYRIAWTMNDHGSPSRCLLSLFLFFLLFSAVAAAAHHLSDLNIPKPYLT